MDIRRGFHGTPACITKINVKGDFNHGRIFRFFDG